MKFTQNKVINGNISIWIVDRKCRLLSLNHKHLNSNILACKILQIFSSFFYLWPWISIFNTSKIIRRCQLSKHKHMIFWLMLEWKEIQYIVVSISSPCIMHRNFVHRIIMLTCLSSNVCVYCSSASDRRAWLKICLDLSPYPIKALSFSLKDVKYFGSKYSKQLQHAKVASFIPNIPLRIKVYQGHTLYCKHRKGASRLPCTTKTSFYY